MVFDHQAEYPSQWATIKSIAQKIGCTVEALRSWVRQDEADRGERADQLSTAERDELKRLRAENTELRRANEILKAASAIFAAGLDRPRTR